MCEGEKSDDDCCDECGLHRVVQCGLFIMAATLTRRTDVPKYLARSFKFCSIPTYSESILRLSNAQGFAHGIGLTGMLACI